MFIQQLTHNRRRQTAAGAAGLALAGIAAFAVIGGAGSTASLAAPASRAQHVTAGVAGASVEADGAAAATIAGTSKWAGNTVRWLVRNHYGIDVVGSAVRASVSPASAGVEQSPAADTPRPSAHQVAMTLPSYTPGRAPSATAPSANVGTLPSAQTGHNQVTVDFGTRPSVTPGAVDAGTVGHVNGPHINVN
jgi:hypothetical protein